MTAPIISNQSLALVVNPTAGRGAAGRALKTIRELCSQRFAHPVRVHLTKRVSDGERLARQAIEEGAEIVAAVGGDGTLHEVANALQSVKTLHPVSLALIPFGTGNDFARAVNLRGTLTSVIDAIATGERRMIDTGLVESSSLTSARRFSGGSRHRLRGGHGAHGQHQGQVPYRPGSLHLRCLYNARRLQARSERDCRSTAAKQSRSISRWFPSPTWRPRRRHQNSPGRLT